MIDAAPASGGTNGSATSSSSSPATTASTQVYTRALRRRARMNGVDTSLPLGRPLRRHAGGARRSRRRRGAVAGTAALRPRRRRGAGHGPAGGGHHGRRAAGKYAGAAAHARRTAHRLAGAAGERRRSRARYRQALRLNPIAYEALGARARQFAEFMFSPQSVAEAIRGVYTSLWHATLELCGNLYSVYVELFRAGNASDQAAPDFGPRRPNSRYW